MNLIRELFLAGFFAGWFARGLTARLVFFRPRRPKTPLETGGELNRFDFIGPVPRGNSILEIRSRRKPPAALAPFAKRGDAGDVLLRLDAYTLVSMMAIGEKPGFSIHHGPGREIVILVDGREQTPPPGRG